MEKEMCSGGGGGDGLRTYILADARTHGMQGACLCRDGFASTRNINDKGFFLYSDPPPFGLYAEMKV